MAARIPQEILDEIMSRADILDIVAEYVPLQRKGRNYFGLCPFHEEDTPSFSVNQDKQFFKCFGCGEGGNTISFLMKIENLSFPEAARKLADRYGIVIPEKELSPADMAAQQEKQKMLDAHSQAAVFYAKMLDKSPIALAYLKKRGIDKDITKKFGLGFAPEADWQALTNHLTDQGFSEALLIKAGLISRSAKNGRCFDKFHGRVIFPIRDNRGSVIAFGGRILLDEQPKYLNSMNTPIYNKSNHLYALDLAASAIAKDKQVVIMEGYMDVLTAHQYGITNAVASLGTAFTDQQARLLSRLAPQMPEKLSVLLSFDGDGAGAKAAMASLTKLATYDFAEPQVLVIPENLDPDDFLRKYEMRGWQRLLERYCYPLLDYLLLRTLERHDINSASGKGAIVADLLPAIAKARNQTERESFIRRLARKLGVSEDAILTDLAKSGLVAGQKISRTPTKTAPKATFTDTAARKASRELLALAITNQEIFIKANKNLAGDFGMDDEERQLISFIKELGADYDFHPPSLFNYLEEENEGLKRFLLKLIDTEVVTDEPNALAEGYITTIREGLKKESMAAADQQIESNPDNYDLQLENLAKKFQTKKNINENNNKD